MTNIFVKNESDPVYCYFINRKMYISCAHFPLNGECAYCSLVFEEEEPEVLDLDDNIYT